MKQPWAERKPVLHKFTAYLLSDAVFAIPSRPLNIVKNFLSSAFGTATNLNKILISVGRRVSALLSEWTLAMAAPLRRIVARDVAVFVPDARNPRYRIYSLIDVLECGHEYDAYLFGGL